PHGTGVWASRSAVVSSGAAASAAREVKERLLAIAGHLLEVDPADLEIGDGVVRVAGAPNVHLGVDELVEVEEDSGLVHLVDYACVEDCGVLINPEIVDGQIRGGVAQGIGGALFERL